MFIKESVKVMGGGSARSDDAFGEGNRTDLSWESDKNMDVQDDRGSARAGYCIWRRGQSRLV